MLKKSFILSLFLLVFLNCTLFIGSSSAVSSPSNDGFIIEAAAVKGVMGMPELVTGETTSKPEKLMLRIKYTNVKISGLILTKQLNTPAGPIAVKMKADGLVKIRAMTVDVTKLDFEKMFITKDGEMGMKNVRLVAHKQTGASASLPGLSVSFEKNVSINTDGASDDELTQLAAKLTDIIKSKDVSPDDKSVPSEEIKNSKEDAKKTTVQQSSDTDTKKQDPKSSDQANTNKDDSSSKNSSGREQDKDMNKSGNQSDSPAANPDDNTKDQTESSSDDAVSSHPSDSSVNSSTERISSSEEKPQEHSGSTNSNSSNDSVSK